jgi:hypothetical protein
MKFIPHAIAAAGCLALSAFVSSTAVNGQSPQAPAGTYAAPRTPWGDPDLQGKWPSTDLVGVPMQRDQKLGTRNVLTEEEFTARQAQFARQAAQDEAEFDLDQATSTPGGDVGGPVSPPPHWLERGKPQYQASLIVDPQDGRMPAFTPEALQRQAAQRDAQAARRKELNGREADTYLDRSLYDRCITRGIAGSILPIIYNNGNEIVQGPGWVAIRNEMIHETRVVPLDGRPHPDASIRLWMGDSRGDWEGDTLVVETTNFDPRTSGIAVNGGGARISDALKITERLTRVGADLLSYEMKVEDPKTWTRPWTMQYPLRLDNDYGFYEYACHEGNYAMFNILSGSRAAEKK